MSRDERGREGTTLTTQRRRAVVPSLVVVAHGGGGEISVPLGLASIVIGTSEECELRVEDDAVSRRHCSITLTPEGVVVRDLGSTNGTFVGGVDVREAFLTTTSVMRIGGIDVRLRIAGAPSELPLWPGASFGRAIGGSVPMRALFEQLQRAAVMSQPVLLLGEPGTGKELLAEAIHEASSYRDGPFVVLDAGSLSSSLAESELFGHVKGAFTGAADNREGLLAAARTGTLFIDEIGELPLDLQPRLLRVLEARQYRPVGSSTWLPFEARVVAATNRDLRAAIARGMFREDLFYRLSVIEARVPPLRERKEDIELLVERFLAAEAPPRTLLDLPGGALALLMSHDWPGNVRELKNTVARLALFPDAPEMAFDVQGVEGEARGAFDTLLAMRWRDARERVLDRFEESYIRAKLRENGNGIAKTAAAMGISRQMLHRLMTRHGLRTGEP